VCHAQQGRAVDLEAQHPPEHLRRDGLQDLAHEVRLPVHAGDPLDDLLPCVLPGQNGPFGLEDLLDAGAQPFVDVAAARQDVPRSVDLRHGGRKAGGEGLAVAHHLTYVLPARDEPAAERGDLGHGVVASKPLVDRVGIRVEELRCDRVQERGHASSRIASQVVFVDFLWPRRWGNGR
jgi:hypothetical protein